MRKFFFLFLIGIEALGQAPKNVTWSEAQADKKATIVIFWYESRPFIYRTQDGRLDGIEYQIMEHFKVFVKAQYKIDLQTKWVETNSFGDTYQRIQHQKLEGTFGCSDFSITEEREAEVSFSPPYMGDVNILVSSKDVPVAHSIEELSKSLNQLTAITIKSTTYEHDLQFLREVQKLSFTYRYLPSSENILKTIAKTEKSFGFIELPVYMMMFDEDPAIGVNRQNLFPIKREGYGIIYPLNGSWKQPIDAYFNSDYFKRKYKDFLPNFVNSEVISFLESIASQPNDPLLLLSKEKEIQSRDLLEKSNRIETDAVIRNWLIGLVTICVIMLLAIALLYRKSFFQREKIRQQGEFIKANNIQLQKRNESLLNLNEEKNNLIRILAHDLRTPVNQVLGLVQLLEMDKASLSEMHQEVVHKISESSTRLSKMITHILDVDSLENNRMNAFFETLHLNTTLQQVAKSFERAASQKEIMLKTELAIENPSISADPLFLTQVIENLVSNAIKFSPPKKTVVISSSVVENRVQLIIADEGPGLTEEDMKLVFKKFTKLSAKPTGGEPSTGLGLSIVKKYVELMKGKVWVESTPKEKTRFVVEFEKA